MNRSTVLKLAASSLVLAGTAIGCTPDGRHPAALSDHAPVRAATAPRRNDAASARLARQATALLAKGKPAQAVVRAEEAVALSPDDADRRALLGRAYLGAGRFLSAELALHDAVTLNPAHGGALLNLALAQIALGEWSAARTTLNDAAGKLPEADRGLGLALAGQADVAIGVLEPAARSAQADAKTRQNLALAYALAGRWADARTVAAQDVPPAELDRRMAEWAAFAQPQAVWQQVASLLHVTPARDAGMPARLALAPARTIDTAAVAPPAMPALAMAAAPDAAPITGARAVETVTTSSPPANAIATAPVPPSFAGAIADSPVASSDRPIFYARPSERRATPLLYAERAARAPSLLVRAVARRAPVATFGQHEQGRWAVQLGAFSAPGSIDENWTRMSGRLRLLAGYTPSQSRRATFRRLALSGFATRADAAALCRRIKAQRGDCFVRPAEGDAPMQMAARKPTVQIASR